MRNVNGDKRRTHSYLQHNILIGGFLLSLFDLHVDRRPPLLHRRDAAVPVGAGLCTWDAKSVCNCPQRRDRKHTTGTRMTWKTRPTPLET